MYSDPLVPRINLLSSAELLACIHKMVNYSLSLPQTKTLLCFCKGVERYAEHTAHITLHYSANAGIDHLLLAYIKRCRNADIFCGPEAGYKNVEIMQRHKNNEHTIKLIKRHVFI